MAGPRYQWIDFETRDMTATKTKVSDRSDALTVALGEYDTGWHDSTKSLRSAGELARRARSAGANLLVLPEMCTTGFTMQAEKYSEPENGSSIAVLAAIAAEHELWLIAGLPMQRHGRYLNSAVAFAPDGSRVATYDKQRLFGYAKETEIYSPGAGPCVIQMGGLSVALFVCFDLRFPELFRDVGHDVDAFVLIANWPSARQRHWEILTQARAIENQCYMIAVNRIGEGDGLKYTGGSVIFDPWGERIDTPAPQSSLRIGEVSASVVAKVRKDFPLTPRQPSELSRQR